ncbi:MAG: PEP-CTERM sorting domain-containing protein, partial [Acidobacteria bacterium]|nr:PEP-CTERM sorting domain-containing protein [Acidobacteriota bacterium]
MNPIFPRQTFSQRRQSLLGATLSLSFLLLVLILAPASARAQSATIFGALSNFDVVNHTEHEAHGFEVELEGLQAQDVYYTFSAQRYGSPSIVPTQTGVIVRWMSSYDPATQQFTQTTVAHAPNTPFAGTCYQWGGASYATSGCEHFGVTLRTTATRTTYRWLIADPQTPGALTPVDPPVAIPAPVYVVLPPAQPAEPPVLEAEIEAPEAPETPETFGNAQWVKVFKTELTREVSLDELVSDNATVPQDAAHVEVAWEILQAEPASNSHGNRNRRQNQGSLSAGTRAVVRRYEIYEYTGAYDPITHEAVCADGLCNAPQDGELGDYVGAQMAA